MCTILFYPTVSVFLKSFVKFLDPQCKARKERVKLWFDWLGLDFCLLSFFFFFLSFCLIVVVVVVVVIVAISWAAPAAYGGSQARG